MTCTKHVYRSRTHAKQATKVLGNRTRAYFCVDCSGWHITNQDKGRGVAEDGFMGELSDKSYVICDCGIRVYTTASNRKCPFCHAE